MSKNNKPLYVVLGATIVIVLIAISIALFITRNGGGIAGGEENFELGEGGRLTGGGGNGEVGTGGGGIRPTPPPSPGSSPAIIPTLRKISSAPVAGSVVFTRNSVQIVRYIERGTGHVYEARADKLETERLSNTTVKAVAEALFAPNGESLLIRYARDDTDEIETVFARLVKRSGDTSATGTAASTTNAIVQTPYDVALQFLERNILFPVILPGKDEFFYFLNRDDGAHGYRARLDGSKKTEVFTSPLREWLATWPTDKSLLLSSKPTGTAQGSAYLYDLLTRTTKKIAGGVGLTAIANSSLEYALIGEVVTSRPILSALTLKTGEKLNLGLGSLPEKCVWSKKTKTLVYCAIPESLPPAPSPDAWYQGRISFNDMLWKIQIPEGAGESLPLGAPVGTTFDMIDLALDPTESHIYFRNKPDGSLWSLRLGTNSSTTPDR